MTEEEKRAKKREYARKWYAEHKDDPEFKAKRKVYRDRYYKGHPEQVRAYSRKNYAKHHDHKIAYVRRYYAEHYKWLMQKRGVLKQESEVEHEVAS